jgi:hypothetical protein
MGFLLSIEPNISSTKDDRLLANLAEQLDGLTL